ncbi:PalH/RIM21-domain-containing protein [Ampelomyces quisqualis]|uniref:PalH/RIM21-domain-containing protein n=1 Tax=Ampelomyces quisqualis TaxID=50730 RepID=A0A6A5R0J5_AMPQU|nr:PalH/RIM21-domain-containing protein [Ampelomyces quisqualis]
MWEDEAWDAAGHLLAPRDQSKPFHCPSYKLPALGVIELGPGHFINLTADAFFRPQCTNAQQSAVDDTAGGITNIADIRDPFHASITPQAYATGAATVIAWMLVIMLIITPRTFFLGNATGRSGLMGRSGMISGATGGGSIIGVGSRPWLQKVAALTVAISLTLATADTFKIAGRQYKEGFIDAMELRDQVVAGMEIKVSRIISDIFIWLAQVQTLIRLFPRHKEKVIIKWVGFALILLDITFSSLNSFGPYENNGRPVHFETAIPALSYLFQLSLSMLYAAWVMYYAITKRRYAFYHSMMWNISVVALLSIIAILTPVVFFITDIANYTIAGWGDYFRWVGAAAASVIVWEWVERIEALEREERKDGILGREIYDGDDMLATTPSSDSRWPSKKDGYTSMDEKKTGRSGGLGGIGSLGAIASAHTDRINVLAHRLGRKMTESPRTTARQKRNIHIPAPAQAHHRSESATRGDRSSRTYIRVQTPPSVPVIASPVSRTDTTSAQSTVYTVRYHPISDTPPAHLSSTAHARFNQSGVIADTSISNQESLDQPANLEDLEKGGNPSQVPLAIKSKWRWQTVANTFRRHGRTPPQELQRGRVIEPLAVDGVTANIPPRNYTGLALADRLGTFAAQQGEWFRAKKKTEAQDEAALPVTIIPAQPRGQTWSPDIVRQQQSATHDETSATAGVDLARVPTAIVEEDALPRTRSAETTSSDDTTQSPSSPTRLNRNLHTRFTPNAAQRANHSSGVLGTPISNTHYSPQPTASVPAAISQQPTHTCTNHDR